MEKMSQLATMVSSTKRDEKRWLKTHKEKSTKATMYSNMFWRDTRELLKIYIHLLKLLRIIDRKPLLGFVYGVLKNAKDKIKVACNRKETTFRPIIDIIETESRGKPDRTL